MVSVQVAGRFGGPDEEGQPPSTPPAAPANLPLVSRRMRATMDPLAPLAPTARPGARGFHRCRGGGLLPCAPARWG